MDESSRYRYYEPSPLEVAETVRLLRRAGVGLGEIRSFLAAPSAGVLDGCERSLVPEGVSRRQALAELRCRLELTDSQIRGTTVVEIRPVRDQAELGDVVDTVIAWSSEILAFHHPRARGISNGRLEGTNNRLQVLRRVAHGLTNRSTSRPAASSPCPAVNDHGHRAQRPSSHELAQP